MIGVVRNDAKLHTLLHTRQAFLTAGISTFGAIFRSEGRSFSSYTIIVHSACHWQPVRLYVDIPFLFSLPRGKEMVLRL